MQNTTLFANTPSDTQPSPMPATEIAGFWRRVFAFMLDGLFLSIPLLMLGFAFRSFAFSLGPWGRLIGYGLLFLYWSVFNSTFREGQTFGKQLLGIAVVDRHGDYLSLPASMRRASILALIGLLNQWALPVLETPVMVVITGTIVLGGGLALLYGVIFNRQTRQGIHDLIAGSYVVKTSHRPKTHLPETPPSHKRITIGLVGAGLILSIAIGVLMQNANPTFGILVPTEWKEIQALRTTLAHNDDFFNVGVRRLNQNSSRTSDARHNLHITVWMKKPCEQYTAYCDTALQQVAQTVFENYAGIDRLSEMRITLINRFDLGLARGSYSHGATQTIDDWRKQLD